MKTFYSDSYTLSSYAFDTTRKAGWVAQSLLSRPTDRVDLIAPPPVTEEQLRLVHEVRYIEAVKSGTPRALAESQGFVWDSLLWPMVCASTGGVVAAARAAVHDGVAGSLSSGLHHARRESGAGFCTFNGLALAALDAVANGAKSVLILDLDAHCGGGTHSLIADDARIYQADVAVSPFDYYAQSGHNRLELVTDASAYLATIRDLLTSFEQADKYDLCLYNAGMDPFEGCAVGGLAGITDDVLRQRECFAFDWLHARAKAVAFVLAGGYAGSSLSQDTLVALHRMTVEYAAGDFVRRAHQQG